MTRKLRFKMSLRDTQIKSVAAQRFMALGAPDEKKDSAMAFVEHQAAAIPPKRKYTKHAIEETEAPVLDAVGDLLWKHPRVLFAVRQNSGSAGYVQFFRIIRQQEGVKLKMPDYWGFLTTNGAPIPFAIECKKPGWSKPSNDREESQAAFLGMIRGLGGLGIFATSAAQVAAALT